MTTPAQPLTSAALTALVEVRYPLQRGWLHCYEAGGLWNRRVDIVAFNLWASRGYQLLGFEAKTYRADWLRELNTPEKVEESISRYCDEWWVVTGPRVVESVEEVPPTWGWLEAVNGKLYTRKKARQLAAKPVDRVLMAALMKRYEAAMRNWDDNQLQRVRAEVRQEIETDEGREIDRLKAETARLEEQLKAALLVERRYERLTGGYTKPTLDRALTLVGELADRYKGCDARVQAARATLVAVDRLLAELEQLAPMLTPMETEVPV